MGTILDCWVSGWAPLTARRSIGTLGKFLVGTSSKVGCITLSTPHLQPVRSLPGPHKHTLCLLSNYGWALHSSGTQGGPIQILTGHRHSAATRTGRYLGLPATQVNSCQRSSCHCPIVLRVLRLDHDDTTPSIVVAPLRAWGQQGNSCRVPALPPRCHGLVSRPLRLRPHTVQDF